MARRWYGNMMNRLEEGRQFTDEIKVGTGITEYHWSDREPWEVIEVKDQKHLTVRQLRHRHIGDVSMDNRWELYSDEEAPCRTLERRGDTWYWTTTITAEDIKDIDEDMDRKVRLIVAGFDPDRIREKGKQTKRSKANISIGIADYYYDYEF